MLHQVHFITILYSGRIISKLVFTWMMQKKQLELTLAVLKPGLASYPPRLLKVLTQIRKEDFEIVQQRTIHWRQDDAAAFYAEHKDRFFYNRLVTFMSSGPMVALILAKENAVKDWRALLGPTKSYKARQTDPSSLRALYGLSDTRNAAHGSDSVETAIKEMKYFFPDFEADEWYERHTS